MLRCGGRCPSVVYLHPARGGVTAAAGRQVAEGGGGEVGAGGVRPDGDGAWPAGHIGHQLGGRGTAGTSSRNSDRPLTANPRASTGRPWRSRYVQP